MNKKISIIGTGFMGSSMLKALAAADGIDNSNIAIYDIDKNKTSSLAKEYGVTAKDDISDAVKVADIIVLAVKPNILPSVLESIKGTIEDRVVVSFAVGVPIKNYKAILGDNAKVVRTMPNTPMAVGEGMTLVSFDDKVTDADKKDVLEMFSYTGQVEELAEKLMTEVTALTGSSPAYTYMYIEALGDGAVSQGIPRNLAYKLAAQAVLGSAKMVLETGEHPGKLKDSVCSPAGTTIKAVEALEKNGFRYAVIDAMNECTKKGKEIEKGK